MQKELQRELKPESEELELKHDHARPNWKSACLNFIRLIDDTWRTCPDAIKYGNVSTTYDAIDA